MPPKKENIRVGPKPSEIHEVLLSAQSCSLKMVIISVFLCYGVQEKHQASRSTGDQESTGTECLGECQSERGCEPIGREPAEGAACDSCDAYGQENCEAQCCCGNETVWRGVRGTAGLGVASCCGGARSAACGA